MRCSGGKGAALVGLGLSLVVAPAVQGQDPQGLLFSLSTTNFARYHMPGECARAEWWLEALYWHDHRPDTAYYPNAGHPDQPYTRQQIAACVSHFTVPDVAAQDLLGLAQAALLAGQVAKADSVFARLDQLGAEAAPAARAWTYYEAVDVSLNAPQPWLLGATRYLAKLDAMGAPAAPERLLAHLELANEAERRDSLPLWTREAQAALMASKALTPDTTRQRYAFESATAYTDLAALQARQNDVVGARATLTAGRTELVPLWPAVARVFNGAEEMYVMQGKTPGPIQVTQWALGGMPGATHPVSGKPALIYFVSAGCGGGCYAEYAILRRLIAQFPPAQLDVIFAVHTEGHWRGDLVPPDSEMGLITAYFLNDLKLPVNVGIWKIDYTRRADQRLVMLPEPAPQAYQPPGDGVVGILDKQGVIRMYVPLNSHYEAMLDDLVRSVM